MAIRVPDLGLGDGKTGDTELKIRQDYNHNFSDQANAASKLVGTGAEEIPQNKHLGAAAYRPVGQVNNGLLQFGDVGLGYTYHSNTATTVTSPDEIPTGFFTTPNESPLKPVGLLGTYDNIGIKIPHNVPYAGGYIMFPYHLGSGNNIVYTAYRKSGAVLETRVFKIYSDRNTTIVNGSLKPSSPVVKIHTDSLELNDDAERMGVILNKRGVGDYLLQNTTGLRNDGGWRIELPQDVNGNPYFAVDYKELENNDIEVKTYKRIFDMNTFMFVPDLDSPIDIKEGRSIAIRFNDLPADVLDDTQTEV